MSNAQLLIFLAVLVQVTLTLVQYVRLLRARFGAVKSGTADLRRAGFDQSAWPEKARLISNSVTSQFELPVLFYVAVLFCFALGAVNWITVILAWLFVAARIIHAAIHTGSNAIRSRLRVFFLGFAVIVVFWLYLAYHVVSGALLFA